MLRSLLKDYDYAVHPHMLYMFEFVVDDLLLTKENLCAPTEYATCVEVSFRSMYTSICDREYGSCVRPGQPKCGKRCIFPLSSKVTKDDCLQIHVFKKGAPRCKFLLGMAEVRVKKLFDCVYRKFALVNRDFYVAGGEVEGKILDKCDCFDDGYVRREQLCPQSETVKQMIPLFNLCNQQSGNLVLIINLVCQGPSLVSSFCRKGNKYVPCSLKKCQTPDPCLWRSTEDDVHPSKGLRYFACNADKLCPCDYCEDEFDRDCPTVPCKRRSPSKVKQHQKNGSCAKNK